MPHRAPSRRNARARHPTSAASSACASRAETSDPVAAGATLPWTRGSSAARSFSSSRGLRQNSSNAWSNSSMCSRRDTSTAASAARKSVLFATPTASTAASASMTFAGPTGMPHARSARTKCSTFSGSLPFAAPARPNSGVIPATAGIQRLSRVETLGPRLRGDDKGGTGTRQSLAQIRWRAFEACRDC